MPIIFIYRVKRLSFTNTTDLHVSRSKLDKNDLEELKDETDFMKTERSGSPTSVVYSPAGSVASDSTVSNCRRS